jgi:hypothetical protein
LIVVNNCKLIWRGGSDPETKLILEDGRNLFDLLPVRKVSFSGRYDEVGKVRLVLDVAGPAWDAESVKVRVSEPDLRRIAEAHGFDLIRKESA